MAHIQLMTVQRSFNQQCVWTWRQKDAYIDRHIFTVTYIKNKELECSNMTGICR